MTDDDPTPAAKSWESTLTRLTRRMRHVYHTRVRTTTVVLIVAWVALSIFHGFSVDRYQPDEPPGYPAQRVQPQQDWRPEPTPTATTPSSTVEEPSPTSAETPMPSGTEGTVQSTDTQTPNRPGEQPRLQAPSQTAGQSDEQAPASGTSSAG